jgi:hypothetical protein
MNTGRLKLCTQKLQIFQISEMVAEWYLLIHQILFITNMIVINNIAVEMIVKVWAEPLEAWEAQADTMVLVKHWD